MERFAKLTFCALLFLITSTAMAESGDQNTQSSCSRYGAQAVGMQAGQPNAGTAAGGNFEGPAGAPAPALSDCGGSNQDTPDIDSLLGAPRDYDDRYGSSTSSELESRSNDLDGGSPSSSTSRSTGSTNPRKSATANASINSAMPAVSGDVYRLPW
jgi:hypothetical protein